MTAAELNKMSFNKLSTLSADVINGMTETELKKMSIGILNSINEDEFMKLSAKVFEGIPLYKLKQIYSNRICMIPHSTISKMTYGTCKKLYEIFYKLLLR